MLDERATSGDEASGGSGALIFCCDSTVPNVLMTSVGTFMTNVESIFSLDRRSRLPGSGMLCSGKRPEKYSKICGCKMRVHCGAQKILNVRNCYKNTFKTRSHTR